MYRGIVLGGTGAVGSALVRELLASPSCSGVTALVRRPVTTFDQNAGREKLTVNVIDFVQLEHAVSAATDHDVAFCTMGMGQPRKASREEFWRVDVEYAGAFARGAAKAGARHISLLSSVGARLKSGAWYLRVKGAAEHAVESAGIARTSHFRPSLLVTKDMRYGLQDRVTQAVFPVIATFLPARFHQIRVEDLGKAMRVNAERSGSPGVEVLQYPEFVALL